MGGLSWRGVGAVVPACTVHFALPWDPLLLPAPQPTGAPNVEVPQVHVEVGSRELAWLWSCP